MGEARALMSAAAPTPSRQGPTPLATVPVRRRRGVRIALLTLLVVLLSLAWGVGTARSDGSFGPHLARYAVTLDGQVTIDLGPLGTLVIDSPAPVLGARVTVEEIPSTLTTVDLSATLDTLSGDLRQYLELFSSPQETLRAVIHDLVVDALRRAAVAALFCLALILVGRWVLGPARRSELAALWTARHSLMTAGVAVTLLTGGTLSASLPIRPTVDANREASAVFDGTPLEGARITGRLAGLIDTYGGYAVDAYRENATFYGGVVTSLDEAWRARARIELRSSRLTSVPESATATPAAADPIVAVVVSDLHCNVGMARVIHEVATLSSADLVLNAGDSTMDGTGVESYCVNAFAAAVPRGAAYVISDGNHDSTETSAQERDAGAHVLAGKVIQVDGLRILGDSDPNATRLGSGTSTVGAESVTDAGHRLADLACDDGNVDLLLIHTPDVGTESLMRGCVPAQVSGHWHRRVGPDRFGEGVRYVSGSTAGAVLNEPTVGPLHGTAELTILRFDPETHAVLDYRIIQVRTDGTVSVEAALQWPTPSSHFPRSGDPV